MSLLDEEQRHTVRWMKPPPYKSLRGEVTASIKIQLLKKKEELEEKEMKVFGVLMKLLLPDLQESPNHESLIRYASSSKDILNP